MKCEWEDHGSEWVSEDSTSPVQDSFDAWIATVHGQLFQRPVGYPERKQCRRSMRVGRFMLRIGEITIPNFVHWVPCLSYDGQQSGSKLEVPDSKLEWFGIRLVNPVTSQHLVDEHEMTSTGQKWENSLPNWWYLDWFQVRNRYQLCPNCSISLLLRR